MSTVGCSQSLSWAGASAAMPGYRLTIFWDCRLTWKVIVPFSTVSVPMPSTASLAWNILLSVLNLAVYTPSGSAAAGAWVSAGAAVAAGAVSSVETASDVLSAVDAADAPQPASSRAAKRQGCELELFHAFLTSFYIYIYQAIAGGSAGGYGIRPYGVAAASHRTQAGHARPLPCFPKNQKTARSLPSGQNEVFLSRSGNQWRPRHGQRRAAGCRRSRPDLRSGCRHSQSSRRR